MRLVEGEGADHEIQVGRQVAGVANFLRPLPLLRRRRGDRRDRQADEVAIVRRVPVPVAPRGRRGQPARPTASSRRSATLPPRSWYDRSGVSTSVTRSKALKLGACSRDRRRSAGTAGSRGAASARRRRRPACSPPAADACGRPRRDRPACRTASTAAGPGRPDCSRSFTSSCVRVFCSRPSRWVPENDSRPATFVSERPGDRRLGLDEAVAAVVQLELGLRREARLPRRDVDRARGGVLAEQRALRSAQHFDPLDVEEVERRRRRPRVEDAVDVEADARLDAVVGQPERRAEAADVDRRVARVGRIELDGRNQLLQPVDVERAGARRRGRRSTTETGIGTSCTTSSTRRAVTTTPSVTRAASSVTSIGRRSDRPSSASAAHGRLESVERSLRRGTRPAARRPRDTPLARR